MARLHSFRIELDAISDAVTELERLARALPTRHGEAFRALDRRVADLIDGKCGQPDVHDLGEGVLAVAAPRELSEILAAGRQLGVI
ncbi:MAG TPA: hypothetical protein VL358_04590 [Caulobacteraceae bacterium]|jgi:hypothetical protein|nr:hypothetical protein [Caulobacteraceae bacterium]